MIITDPKYSATTKKTILGELTDAGANRPTNNGEKILQFENAEMPFPRCSMLVKL